MHRPPRRTAAASWLTSLGGGRAARGAGAAAGEAISNRPSWGSSKTSPEASHVWAGFFQDLRELGCVEGQNEGRFYGDRLERLPVLAAELVRLPVDAIVAGAAPAPEAAKRATSLIPIVFANHPIPSEAGSSPGLARPGGDVTGLSLVALELRVKQLQLLKEAVPELTSVAILANHSRRGSAGSGGVRRSLLGGKEGAGRRPHHPRSAPCSSPIGHGLAQLAIKSRRGRRLESCVKIEGRLRAR